MTITLAQAAELSEDALQRGVIEVFIQESPVLDRLPLLTIEGNAYAYNSEVTLPGVEFRNVNEAYTESTGTVVQAFETLSILGGDADVDRFVQQTRSNLNDQRALQTRLKVKAAAYKFQDTFINGDVDLDPKSFDGLKKRLVGDQILTAGANGAPVLGDGDTDAHAFYDALDALVGQVPGLNGTNGVLYANNLVQAKLRSAARRLGGVEMLGEDATGKRVLSWQGIPVLSPGVTSTGVEILPQTETQGLNAMTSSVYAVKFGENEQDRGVTGLTNGGVSVRDLGEVDVKPVWRTRIEFYCGIATFSGQAAARLKGVLAA